MKGRHSHAFECNIHTNLYHLDIYIMHNTYYVYMYLFIMNDFV